MAALAQDYAPLSDMRASSSYRMQGAQNLLRRFWLETRLERRCRPKQSTHSPPERLRRPTMNDERAPDVKTAAWTAVGVARAARIGPLHVLGQATYTDDIAEVRHPARGAGPVVQGACEDRPGDRPGRRARQPRRGRGLHGADIPGTNDCGPIIHDDPILADGLVQYVGQPIFIVVADSHDNARRAARLASSTYEELPAILTPQAARAKRQSYVLPPMQLARGDAQAAFERAAHKVKGELYVGGQEQFYLKARSPTRSRRKTTACWCSARPSTRARCSTWSRMRWACIRTTWWSNAGAWAAASAARNRSRRCGPPRPPYRRGKLTRPVKLRADRDDDMLVTGKRHCFHYEYEVGYDDDGRILAAKVDMVSRAGYSADLSGPVATRAVCHFDNTYYLSDVDIRAACGKTNTQSNTAFRGFGGPQGAIAMEYVLDEIARNWAATRSTSAS
jgi:xanthine dehydrogenase large subunit